MSEDSGAVPAPHVLDTSVIVAIARGDYSIMTFIQHMDARGQALVIPVLAMTAASLNTRSDDAEALLHGLEQLDNVMIAALRDAEQAARLAAVITRTGLDPWDAHVAAVADAAICPILTLAAAKWREHSADLDQPLHIIEIADPGRDAWRLGDLTHPVGCTSVKAARACTLGADQPPASSSIWCSPFLPVPIWNTG